MVALLIPRYRLTPYVKRLGHVVLREPSGFPQRPAHSLAEGEFGEHGSSCRALRFESWPRRSKTWRIALRGRAHDNAYFAEWARRYTELGTPRKPASRYRVKQTTLNNYISEARARGLLTSNGQGRRTTDPEGSRSSGRSEREEGTEGMRGSITQRSPGSWSV
jgi:hypothetical protein